MLTALGLLLVSGWVIKRAIRPSRRQPPPTPPIDPEQRRMNEVLRHEAAVYERKHRRHYRRWDPMGYCDRS